MAMRHRSKHRLPPKAQKFVDNYLTNGGNAVNAAIAAGYSRKSATMNASEVRWRPDVDAEIRRRAEKAAAKADIKATEVIANLGAIVMSNVQDFIEEDGEGGMRFKPLAMLTREQLAAVSEVTVETLTVGKKPVTRMKLKFWDKNAAATTLCRHFGLFSEGSKGGVSDRETIFHGAVSAVDRLVEQVIAEGEVRVDQGPLLGGHPL